MLASTCLNEYYKFCSLTDETGHVTAASMKQFENLFWPNAHVLNDLSPDFNQIISLSDYVSIVYNILPEEGVQREWRALAHNFNPSQDSISLQVGFRRYEMHLTKILKNGYDNYQKPVHFAAGNERNISIKVIIDVSLNPREAKILAVLPLPDLPQK